VKPTKIYQEFEQLAESLEVKIIQEKGNFMEQRIRALAQAFSRLDISAIYLKPAIRDIIDSEINAA